MAINRKLGSLSVSVVADAKQFLDQLRAMDAQVRAFNELIQNFRTNVANASKTLANSKIGKDSIASNADVSAIEKMIKSVNSLTNALKAERKERKLSVEAAAEAARQKEQIAAEEERRAIRRARDAELRRRKAAVGGPNELLDGTSFKIRGANYTAPEAFGPDGRPLRRGNLYQNLGGGLSDAARTFVSRIPGVQNWSTLVSGADLDRIRQFNKETALGKETVEGWQKNLISLGSGEVFSRFVGNVKDAINILLRFQAARLVILGASTAFAELTTAASSFQDEMSKVRAITGGTVEELYTLSKAAREVGKNTIISANEAAQALEVIAQAGFSVKESEQVLNAVIALSIGGVASISESAKITTTILRAFNLSAENANDVVNVLTATVNKSKSSVEDLNVAFNFAGTTAANVGLDYKELGAVIGVLADNGIRASTQGTAVRQAILSLLEPTAKAKKVFEEFGINLSEINPLTNKFTDILKTLRDAGFGAGEAADAFDKRAAAAISIMIANADAIEGLQGKITNTNAAFDAMAARQESVASKVKILTGNLHELAIGLTDDALPAVGGLVDALTGLVKVLSSPIGIGFLTTFIAGGAIAGAVKVVTSLVNQLAAAQIVGSRLADFFRGQAKVSYESSLQTANGLQLINIGLDAQAAKVSTLRAAFATLGATLRANLAYLAAAVVIGTLVAAYEKLKDQQRKTEEETKRVTTAVLDSVESIDKQRIALKQAEEAFARSKSVESYYTNLSRLRSVIDELLLQYPELIKFIDEATGRFKDGANVDLFLRDKQVDLLDQRLQFLRRLELDLANKFGGTALRQQEYQALEKQIELLNKLKETVFRAPTKTQNDETLQKARDLAIKEQDAPIRQMQADARKAIVDNFKSTFSGYATTPEQQQDLLSGITAGISSNQSIQSIIERIKKALPKELFSEGGPLNEANLKIIEQVLGPLLVQYQEFSAAIEKIRSNNRQMAEDADADIDTLKRKTEDYKKEISALNDEINTSINNRKGSLRATNRHNEYDAIIQAEAARQQIDAAKLKAIFETEGWTPKGKSPKGALGLGQIMPDTAEELLRDNREELEKFRRDKESYLKDVNNNIRLSAKYYKQLSIRFHGNDSLIAAAYNAGPNRKSLEEGRIPNIQETQLYVDRYLSNLAKLKAGAQELQRVFSNDTTLDVADFATANLKAQQEAAKIIKERNETLAESEKEYQRYVSEHRTSTGELPGPSILSKADAERQTRDEAARLKAQVDLRKLYAAEILSDTRSITEAGRKANEAEAEQAAAELLRVGKIREAYELLLEAKIKSIESDGDKSKAQQALEIAEARADSARKLAKALQDAADAQAQFSKKLRDEERRTTKQLRDNADRAADQAVSDADSGASLQPIGKTRIESERVRLQSREILAITDIAASNDRINELNTAISSAQDGQREVYLQQIETEKARIAGLNQELQIIGRQLDQVQDLNNSVVSLGSKFSSLFDSLLSKITGEKNGNSFAASFKGFFKDLTKELVSNFAKDLPAKLGVDINFKDGVALGNVFKSVFSRASSTGIGQVLTGAIDKIGSLFKGSQTPTDPTNGLGGPIGPYAGTTVPVEGKFSQNLGAIGQNFSAVATSAIAIVQAFQQLNRVAKDNIKATKGDSGAASNLKTLQTALLATFTAVGTAIGAVAGAFLFGVGAIPGAAGGAVLGAQLGELVYKAVTKAISSSTESGVNKGITQKELRTKALNNSTLKLLSLGGTSLQNDLGHQTTPWDFRASDFNSNNAWKTGLIMLGSILNPIGAILQNLVYRAIPSIELILKKLVVEIIKSNTGLVFNRQLDTPGEGLNRKQTKFFNDLFGKGGEFSTQLRSLSLLASVSVGGGNDLEDRLQGIRQVLGNNIIKLSALNKEAVQGLINQVARALTGDSIVNAAALLSTKGGARGNAKEQKLRSQLETAYADKNYNVGQFITFLQDNNLTSVSKKQNKTISATLDAAVSAFSAGTVEEAISQFGASVGKSVSENLTKALQNAFLAPFRPVLSRFYKEITSVLKPQKGKSTVSEEDIAALKDNLSDTTGLFLQQLDLYGGKLKEFYRTVRDLNQQLEDALLSDQEKINKRSGVINQILSQVNQAIAAVESTAVAIKETQFSLGSKIFKAKNPDSELVNTPGSESILAAGIAEGFAKVKANTPGGTQNVEGQVSLLRTFESQVDNFLSTATSAIRAQYQKAIDLGKQASEALQGVKDTILGIKTSRQNASSAEKLKVIADEIKAQRQIFQNGTPEEQLDAAKKLQGLYSQSLELGKKEYDQSGPLFRSLEDSTITGLKEVSSFLENLGAQGKSAEEQMNASLTKIGDDAASYYQYIEDKLIGSGDGSGLLATQHGQTLSALQAITEALIGKAGGTDLYSAISNLDRLSTQDLIDLGNKISGLATTFQNGINVSVGPRTPPGNGVPGAAGGKLNRRALNAFGKSAPTKGQVQGALNSVISNFFAGGPVGALPNAAALRNGLIETLNSAAEDFPATLNYLDIADLIDFLSDNLRDLAIPAISSRISSFINKAFKAIPRAAKGGLFNTSTLTNIGEAGPEAVVPLNATGVTQFMGLLSRAVTSSQGRVAAMAGNISSGGLGGGVEITLNIHPGAIQNTINGNDGSAVSGLPDKMVDALVFQVKHGRLGKVIRDRVR